MAMATNTPLLVSSCNGCRPYPHRHRHFPKPNALPPLRSSLRTTPAASLVPLPRRRRNVSAAYGDDDMDDDFGDFDADDADGVGDDDDIDNEQDYDVDYDRLLAPVKPPPPSSLHGEEGDIAMVAADSFVSTQDSASDTVVDYAVDENEFHKISLLHCDFLIRKVPDPDDDVFDFREVRCPSIPSSLVILLLASAYCDNCLQHFINFALMHFIEIRTRVWRCYPNLHHHRYESLESITWTSHGIFCATDVCHAARH